MAWLRVVSFPNFIWVLRDEYINAHRFSIGMVLDWVGLWFVYQEESICEPPLQGTQYTMDTDCTEQSER